MESHGELGQNLATQVRIAVNESWDRFRTNSTPDELALFDTTTCMTSNV